MSTRHRVLVVEDDDRTRALLDHGLTESGYEVETRSTGEAALACLPPPGPGSADAFDAILLDVTLPGMDGREVCRRVRHSAVSTPVLMLTARGALGDRVSGLDAGADDYLVKPFHFQELFARLRALIRRGHPEVTDRLGEGTLELDEEGALAWCEGREVVLTPSEARVLAVLMRRVGTTVTRSTIADEGWGGTLDLRSNVIDVHVRALRKKLSEHRSSPTIDTVRGVGYRLTRDG